MALFVVDVPHRCVRVRVLCVGSGWKPRTSGWDSLAPQGNHRSYDVGYDTSCRKYISTGRIPQADETAVFEAQFMRPKWLEEAWLTSDTVELVLGRVLANPQ